MEVIYSVYNKMWGTPGHLILRFIILSYVDNIANTCRWRHNERDSVSNRRRLGCLINHLFRRRSKKTSKLRVTGLCEGYPPVTGGFPSQRASNTKSVSIWWCHHVSTLWCLPSSFNHTKKSHVCWWHQCIHLCAVKITKSTFSLTNYWKTEKLVDNLSLIVKKGCIVISFKKQFFIY